MKYDPDTHHRLSIRLKGYDYSKAGYYFVTICTRKRELYFKEYPELNMIVEREWINIPIRYFNVKLDEFVIMPNHFHGIIIVDEIPVGATLAVAQNNNIIYGENKVAINHKNSVRAILAVAQNNNVDHDKKRAGASPAPTKIGNVIGSFKSLCVNHWLQFIHENNVNATGKIWQRNYYDHIIRGEKELENIRQYIMYNPLQWEFDRENSLSENYNMEFDHYFRGVYEQQ